jgi:hypothetical protein
MKLIKTKDKTVTGDFVFDSGKILGFYMHSLLAGLSELD